MVIVTKSWNFGQGGETPRGNAQNASGARYCIYRARENIAEEKMRSVNVTREPRCISQRATILHGRDCADSPHGGFAARRAEGREGVHRVQRDSNEQISFRDEVNIDARRLRDYRELDYGVSC